MDISKEINVILQVFADGLKNILGEKLHGVYIYGATVFPDTLPVSNCLERSFVVPVSECVGVNIQNIARLLQGENIR